MAVRRLISRNGKKQPDDADRQINRGHSRSQTQSPTGKANRTIDPAALNPAPCVLSLGVGRVFPNARSADGFVTRGGLLQT